MPQADVERSLRARVEALLADEEERVACDAEAGGDAPEPSFLQAPSGAPPLVRELPRRVFARVKARVSMCWVWRPQLGYSQLHSAGFRTLKP